MDFPDRELSRVSTARFRIFASDPDGDCAGQHRRVQRKLDFHGHGATNTIAIGGTGLLFLPPLLMIVFRQKYPRWWFDWNLELLRLTESAFPGADGRPLSVDR